MKLKPEYQEIYKQYTDGKNSVYITVQNLISSLEQCQAIADKPQVRLSLDVARTIYDSQPTVNRGLTAVLDAYEAAQREPVEVPFDFEKWKTGEWDLILNGFPTGTPRHIFLDSIPSYTMRRKP